MESNESLSLGNVTWKFPTIAYTKSGTIFNLPIDVALFLIPILIPLGIYLFGMPHSSSFRIYAVILAVKLFIDSMHLASTLFAALHKAQIGHTPRWLVYSSPLVILSVGSLMAQLDYRVFILVVMYWSLLHFYRQNFGFVMMSRAKAKESRKTRWMDSLMVTNLMFYPFVYLHWSDLRTIKFMSGEWYFHVSDSFKYFSWSLFWAINVLYLLNLGWQIYRRQPLNIGKLLVLLNAGLIHYLCLVVLQDFWLWAFANGLTHGLPYIALTYQSSFQGKFAVSRVWGASKWLFLPIVMGWAAYFNFGPPSDTYLPRIMLEILFPLYFLPSLLHYYLDTFIWRNRGAYVKPA